jgi:hypothetical protein
VPATVTTSTLAVVTAWHAEETMVSGVSSKLLLLPLYTRSHVVREDTSACVSLGQGLCEPR